MPPPDQTRLTASDGTGHGPGTERPGNRYNTNVKIPGRMTGDFFACRGP